MSGRLLLGTIGVGFGLWGVFKIFTAMAGPDRWATLRWFVAGILVHDAVIAPAAVVIGLVVFALVRGHLQAWLRPILLGLACLAVFLGVLLGARPSRQNATVLPTDPALAALIGFGALAVALLVARTVVGISRRHHRRS